MYIWEHEMTTYTIRDQNHVRLGMLCRRPKQDAPREDLVTLDIRLPLEQERVMVEIPLERLAKLVEGIQTILRNEPDTGSVPGALELGT